uniref:Tetratricopeptide repeat protein n=1 Tax=Dictyoglomus thermophilum TaxID=14 RepID=A0A7C3MMR5_DICTH
MNKNLPKWFPYVIVVIIMVIIIGVIISTTGKKAPEQGSTPETPAVTSPVETVKEKTPDEEAYEKARELYYDAKYKEAIEAYRKFIKDFPDSEYADDAQYEIALSYEFLEDYKKAIEEYEKLIKNYPNSEYVESAKSSIDYLKDYLKQ